MFELKALGLTMAPILASCVALVLVYPLQVVLILTICEAKEPEKEQSEYEMQASLLQREDDIACDDVESFESAENMSALWQPLTASCVNALKELRSKGIMSLYRAFGLQVLYSVLYETILYLLRRLAGTALTSLLSDVGPASMAQDTAFLALGMLMRVCLLPLDVLTTLQVIDTTASLSSTTILAIFTNCERRTIRNLLITHLLVVMLPESSKFFSLQDPRTLSSFTILSSILYQLFGYIIVILPLQHLAYLVHIDMVHDHIHGSVISLGRRHESNIVRLKYFYNSQNSFPWYRRSRQVLYLLVVSWAATIAISILLSLLGPSDSTQFWSQ